MNICSFRPQTALHCLLTVSTTLFKFLKSTNVFLNIITRKHIYQSSKHSHRHIPVLDHQSVKTRDILSFRSSPKAYVQLGVQACRQQFPSQFQIFFFSVRGIKIKRQREMTVIIYENDPLQTVTTHKKLYFVALKSRLDFHSEVWAILHTFRIAMPQSLNLLYGNSRDLEVNYHP